MGVHATIAGVALGRVARGALRLAVRPQEMGWRDLFAVAMLGGVGFAMSLLIAELALAGAATEGVKAVVLIASVLASLLAAALLLRRNSVRDAPVVARSDPI